jgi:hypothetical protein
VRILGPPSATRGVARYNAAALPGIHARFIDDMFPALWKAAITYGVDPVGVLAQSFKETGGGNFTGKVRAEFCNPCGLKNRASLFPGVDDGDLPLAHARFANWYAGAVAHVQHLAAYAGATVPGVIVDPRFDFVAGKNRLENFEDLGGKWAPDPAYGTSVVATARKLQTAIPVAKS